MIYKNEIPKFKVGDRIRVLCDNEWIKIKDKEGVVLKIEFVGTNDIQYNVDIKAPWNLRVKEKDLEKC